MWYVRSGDKNLGPYPEAQLREFIAAGKLPPTAYVLQQGTQQWLRVQDSPLVQPLAIAEEAPAEEPEVSAFDYLSSPSPTPATPPTQLREPAKEQLQNPYWTDFSGQPSTPAAMGNYQNLGYVYRSPETLKTVLLILAGVLVIAHVCMIVSLYLQIDLLTKFKQGVYANNQVKAQADADVNDRRHMLVLFSQVGLTLVYAIVFCFWTHRVKANTLAFGAKGLSITPGWGVGWYFVPFANLVMPYTSMQETWKASAAPSEWYRQPGGSLVGFWWFFWISSSILERIGAFFAKSAEQIDSLIGVSYFEFFAEFYNFLPLIFVTLLVLRITKMQTHHAHDGGMSMQHSYAGY